MDAPDGESVQITGSGIKLASRLFLPTNRPAPALVVGHGAGDSKEPYFEFCEYLRKSGIATLALDLAGHGESEGPRFHVKIRQWVADYRAALDYLCGRPEIDAQRLGAFGISSSGTAVLEAALEEPRLRVLVTSGATVCNSLPFALALIIRTFVCVGKIKRAITGKDLRVPLAKLGPPPQFASDPEVNRKILSNPKVMESLMAFPFPGAAEAFFADTIKRVPKITVPTLVLWGAEDKVDPPETGKKLFEALTCKKQLQIIPGSGHAVHLDRSKQKVFELTAEWVSENLAAAARAAAA
jgi:alpha-beta hydrolase superfamily lysophospholipase